MQDKPYIMEYYKTSHITDEERLTDEELDQFYEELEEKKKIPEQHLQMVNINGQQIPVATMWWSNRETKFVVTQGILCIYKKSHDYRTLKSILLNYADSILDEYNKNKKELVHRSYEEYLQIVDKYVEYFKEKLGLEEVKLKHVYFQPHVLSLTHKTEKNMVRLNAYLRYMDEDTIRYAIYSALCRRYTYDQNQVLDEQDEYHKLIRIEYTLEEKKEITGDNILRELE